MAVFVIVAYANSTYAQMSSTNYQITADSFSSLGSESSESGSYILRDSGGTVSSASATSASFQLDAGYRAQIYDQVSTFELGMQNGASETAVTNLSGSEITVTSTSGYVLGDLVALVQDSGENQQVAVGVVEAVAGTITVDFLSHALTIDGTNDYLYRLSSSSISLGSLSKLRVSTSVVGWQVTSDSPNGYTVYVYDDGDLSYGANVIADVADGSVTAGVSEYGGRSTDSTLVSTFDTQDTGFTETLQDVASRSVRAFKERDALSIKASYETGQVSGGYGHAMEVVYVGAY